MLQRTKTETYLRRAREQSSQHDIVECLRLAIDELTKDVKRLDERARRLRRDAEVGPRFRTAR